MSLVRQPNGNFILIDAYELDESDQDELMALTNGGSQIEAVLNIHPFHTVHCEFIQNLLPSARLIGTRRHREQLSNLRWDPALIEDATTQRQFSDIFEFSIPDGIDFISDDETIHVGSVIVRHRSSGIIHVDDTLMFLDLPSLVQRVIPGPELRFHPKLAEGLEKRAGAADDYIAWARNMSREWADTTIVCAAHNGIVRMTDQSFAEAIAKALEHASETLDQHRKTCG